MLSRCLCLCALLACAVLRVAASAPTVVDVFVARVNFPVDGQQIDAQVATIVFDRPIKVAGHSLAEFEGQVECSSGGGDSGGDCMPAIALELGGFAKFTRASTVVQSYGDTQNSQGPPAFALVAPPTAEPVPSFLSTMRNSSRANDTWLTDRVSFALLNIDTPLQEWSVVFPGTVHAEFNPAPGRKLASANDSSGVFHGTVSLAAARRVDTCTFERFQAFARRLEALAVEMPRALTDADSKALEWRLAIELSSQVLSDCRSLIDSKFLLYANATQIVDNIPNACFAARDSAEFAADPCCNRTLADTQCCVPKSGVEFAYQKLVGYNSAHLQETQHPAEIRLVLQDWVQQRVSTASAAYKAPGSDDYAQYQTKMAFMQTCQTEVWQKTCRVDSDCPYGSPPQCGGNGQCVVDWTQAARYLIPCYVRTMDADVRAALTTLLGVPVWADSVQQEQAFVETLSAEITSDDCVGPQWDKAQPYASRWNDTTRQWIAADEEGCLAVQGCNWNSWQNTSPESCEGGQLSTHFCGLQEWGGYRDIMQQQAWRNASECAKGFCTHPSFGMRPPSSEMACTVTSVCTQPCATEHNPWAQCEFEDECLLRAQCTDMEFQGQCTQIDGQSVCGPNAACVAPFTLNAEGRREMNCGGSDHPELRWSRVGCIHSDITSHEACTAHGWRWYTRATSEQACLAEGQACVPPFNWGNANGMSTQACADCGGRFGPLYEWVEARWIPARFLQTQWMQRAWGPINSFVPSIDQRKVNALMQRVITYQRLNAQLNDFSLQYLQPLAVMRTIVCDYLHADDDCLRFLPTTLESRACIVQPNSLNECDGVTFDARVSDNATLTTARTFVTPLGSFLLGAVSGASRRRLLSFDTDTYEIVRNAAGFTVGQLVGPGKSATVVGGANQTCLDRSLSIPPLNSLYTEPGFVIAGNVSGVVVLQPQIVVVMTGTQLCANVPDASVVYFPVLTAADPESVNTSLADTALDGTPVVVVVVQHSAASAMSYAGEWWVWFIVSLVVVMVVVGVVCIVQAQRGVPFTYNPLGQIVFPTLPGVAKK